MRNRLVVLQVLLLVSIATAAAADWKARAMWCASELAVTQGGDVAVNLQSHAAAHERYCDACSSGSDQFDSTLACYRGNDEKWGPVRQEVEKAGRETLNEFMRAKAPSCCSQ